VNASLIHWVISKFFGIIYKKLRVSVGTVKENTLLFFHGFVTWKKKSIGTVKNLLFFHGFVT
jgi:hypothetical protein